MTVLAEGFSVPSVYAPEKEELLKGGTRLRLQYSEAHIGVGSEQKPAVRTVEVQHWRHPDAGKRHTAI